MSSSSFQIFSATCGLHDLFAYIPHHVHIARFMQSDHWLALGMRTGKWLQQCVREGLSCLCQFEEWTRWPNEHWCRVQFMETPAYSSAHNFEWLLVNRADVCRCLCTLMRVCLWPCAIFECVARRMCVIIDVFLGIISCHSGLLMACNSFNLQWCTFPTTSLWQASSA